MRDDEFDPHRAEREIKAYRRPWRPIIYLTLAVALVASFFLFDVSTLNPWWDAYFTRDKKAKSDKDLLDAFAQPGGDWNPAPPVIPEPTTITVREPVYIPAMTVAAPAPPPVPDPPAPQAPKPPGVAIVKSDPSGPIMYVADNANRPPLDVIDGRVPNQSPGCLLTPDMVIHAALLEPVQWDLGGQISAVVTREVRPPEELENLLIPIGATLIGQAAPQELRRGMDFAPAPVWTAVSWVDQDTHERRTRRLMGATGANVSGVNGIGGIVDQRWGPVIGLMAATTVTDFISSISVSVGSGDSVNANIRGSSAGRIAEEVAKQLLDINPTIRTEAGTQLLIKPIVPIRMC